MNKRNAVQKTLRTSVLFSDGSIRPKVFAVVIAVDKLFEHPAHGPARNVPADIDNIAEQERRYERRWREALRLQGATNAPVVASKILEVLDYYRHFIST